MTSSNAVPQAYETARITTAAAATRSRPRFDPHSFKSLTWGMTGRRGSRGAVAGLFALGASVAVDLTWDFLPLPSRSPVGGSRYRFRGPERPRSTRDAEWRLPYPINALHRTSDGVIVLPMTFCLRAMRRGYAVERALMGRPDTGSDLKQGSRHVSFSPAPIAAIRRVGLWRSRKRPKRSR